MVKRFCYILLFLSLFSIPLLSQSRITSSEAIKYIDKEVIVSGKVDEVKTMSNGNVFICLGGKYPENDFTAVILKSDFDKFKKVDLYVSKEVDIQGTVTEYNGNPEIMVNDTTQIRLSDKKP